VANPHKRLDDFFQKPTQEPEELKKYYEDLNKGVDPSKQTVTDRVAMFFRSLVERAQLFYKRDKKELDVDVKEKSKFRHKITVYYRFLVQKFIELFNFEAEVDILDTTSVLYQRNKVNRRILFIINIIFIIITFIGNQNPNLAFVAGFAIIMFIISRTLRKIINEKPRTLLKQQMAMYFGSVYILIASIGVYIKLRVSAGNASIGDLVGADATSDIISYMTDISISQAGYVLIYFALIVISLYQDATLLRILFRWVFGFMFLVHIFIMYPLYEYASPTATMSAFENLYNYLAVTNLNVTIDIAIRTVVLVVFYIALYSSVSIGQMMNNKRKEEMIKRREMEQDFTAVVGDVFDVIGVFNSHTINQNKEDVHRVAEMASRLANILGLSSRVCSEIYNYSVIHIDKVQDLSILEYEGKDTLTEKDYEDIREKTILGSVVIKRLQLNQKSEDICRMHFEQTIDPNFTEKMKRIQRSQEGQIILLAEIYDILRQERNYKSELKHKRAIDLLQLEFKEYFEPYILDRFLKYQMEFEKFYGQYKYSELGDSK
jgi:hypothetical protein